MGKNRPYYQQVREDIKDKILSGNFKQGSYLPCEQKLGEEYRVSRTTIRSAINELVQDGYLYIVRGKGTKVAYSRLVHNNPNLLSFTEILKSHGFESQMLERHMEIIKADENLIEKIPVELGEEVIRIYRVRAVDSEPVSINTSYLPKRLFSNQNLEYLTEGDSMYENLKKYFHIIIAEVREEIWAMAADSQIAEVLDVKKKAPLLAFEREAFNKEGTFIEYSEVVYRSDRYKHSVLIRGREG